MKAYCAKYQNKNKPAYYQFNYNKSDAIICRYITNKTMIMKIKKITNLFSLIAITALLSFGTVSCNCEGNDCSDSSNTETSTTKGDSKCGDAKCGDAKCGGADAKGEKVDHFSSVDTDANGFISKEEFSAHGEVEFKEKDTDNDGSLTKEGCKMFDKFNTDGNDLLSKEEFVAGHDMMFTKLDSDGDSNISKEEMKAFMAKMTTKADVKAEAKCGEGKCGGK